MKDIATKSVGDKFLTTDCNSMSAELENVVISSGGSLNSADNYQVSKGIATYAGSSDYYTDTGTANAYALGAIDSKQIPIAYVDGLRVRFKPANTNTTASTVTLSGLTAKSIKKIINGTAVNLTGGELVQNTLAEMIYNASSGYFEIVHQEFLSKNLLNLYKKIDGLLLSNNIATPNTKIDLAPGFFVDAGLNNVFQLASTLTKKIDVTWTEGNDAGGLASGLSLAPSTCYHFFVIAKTNGTVDAGFDTSATATNLLTGATAYSYYKLITSIYTDGSSHIIPFHMSQTGMGRMVQWMTPIEDVAASNPPTTSVLRTLTVPIGRKVMVNVIVADILGGIGSVHVYVSSPNVNDIAISIINCQVDSSAPSATHDGHAELFIETNTLAQIRTIIDESGSPNNTLYVTTRGWVEPE